MNRMVKHEGGMVHTKQHDDYLEGDLKLYMSNEVSPALAGSIRNIFCQ